MMVAFFGGLTVILGAVYMLRAYQAMMHGETNSLSETFGEISKDEKIVLYGFAVLVIFFGLFPNTILDVSEQTVKQLIDHVHSVTNSSIK